MFAPTVVNIWINTEAPRSLHGGSDGDHVTYGEDHHWSTFKGLAEARRKELKLRVSQACIDTSAEISFPIINNSNNNSYKK